MANLKSINMKKFIISMNKVSTDFKLIKELIRKEIKLNNGKISYSRIEEYDDLILQLKKVVKINQAFIEDNNLVSLEGKEFTIFCEKIHLNEDILFKYQILLQRIDSFDLNKYIKIIQKEIETTILDEQIEQIENLENLAYKDKLTGLYNRAKYDENISNIMKNDNFSVIFIDLNDLKKTNDSLGHEMGDKLLKTFTNLLNKSRTGEEELYRLGGDEFVAIFNNSDKYKVSFFIDTLSTYIEENNLDINNIQVSFAYGIAYANEEDSSLTINELVDIADKRMYDMKVKMKKNRV